MSRCSYFLNEKKGWGLEIPEMKRALAEARSKGAGHARRVRIVAHGSALSDAPKASTSELSSS